MMRLRARRLVLAVISAFLAVASENVAAQTRDETIVIGGSGRSSVEVNLDALAPAGPRAPFGRSRPGGLKVPNASPEDPTGRIILTPPGAPSRRPLVAPPAPAAKPAPPRQATAAPPAPRETARAESPPPPPPLPAETAPQREAAAPPTSLAGPPEPAAPPARAEPPPPAVPPQAPPPAPAAPVAQAGTAAVAATPRPAQEPRAVASDAVLRILFDPESEALSEIAAAQLSSLAERMAATEDRIELKAYAGRTGDRSNEARRLSLKRAFAVRAFLIEKGVRSTRIDLRALGIAQDGPAERVDIELPS